jgi:hypothetical protein
VQLQPEEACKHIFNKITFQYKNFGKILIRLKKLIHHHKAFDKNVTVAAVVIIPTTTTATTTNTVRV